MARLSAEEFVEAHTRVRRFRRLEEAGIDLGYISAISPLHLRYISPISQAARGGGDRPRRRGRVPAGDGLGFGLGLQLGLGLGLGSGLGLGLLDLESSPSS